MESNYRFAVLQLEMLDHRAWAVCGTTNAVVDADPHPLLSESQLPSMTALSWWHRYRQAVKMQLALVDHEAATWCGHAIVHYERTVQRRSMKTGVCSTDCQHYISAGAASQDASVWVRWPVTSVLLTDRQMLRSWRRMVKQRETVQWMCFDMDSQIIHDANITNTSN